MKKNNLLKTVLLFLFAVFLLQGCRSENIMDTNKSEYTYTHIVSKEVKSLKDVPIFKAFIDDNKNEGQLKSLSKKISGENNIVVIKAAEALGKIGGESAFRALMELLNHQEPDVQMAASEAIDNIRNSAGV